MSGNLKLGPKMKKLHVQSGHRQRTPPGPGHGPCVSLGFCRSGSLFLLVWLFFLLAFEDSPGQRPFVFSCFLMSFCWFSGSVFVSAVSLDSALTVKSSEVHFAVC